MGFLNREEFGAHVGDANFDPLGAIEFSCDVDAVHGLVVAPPTLKRRATRPWPSYLPAALGLIPIIAMTIGLFRKAVVHFSPNERIIRIVANLTVTFTFFAMHAAINAIIRFG